MTFLDVSSTPIVKALSEHLGRNNNHPSGVINAKGEIDFDNLSCHQRKLFKPNYSAINLLCRLNGLPLFFWWVYRIRLENIYEGHKSDHWYILECTTQVLRLWHSIVTRTLHFAIWSLIHNNFKAFLCFVHINWNHFQRTFWLFSSMLGRVLHRRRHIIILNWRTNEYWQPVWQHIAH